MGIISATGLWSIRQKRLRLVESWEGAMDGGNWSPDNEHDSLIEHKENNMFPDGGVMDRRLTRQRVAAQTMLSSFGFRASLASSSLLFLHLVFCSLLSPRNGSQPSWQIELSDRQELLQRSCSGKGSKVCTLIAQKLLESLNLSCTRDRDPTPASQLQSRLHCFRRRAFGVLSRRRE